MKVKIFSVIPGSMAWGDISMPDQLEKKVNEFLLSVHQIIAVQQTAIDGRLIITIFYK